MFQSITLHQTLSCVLPASLSKFVLNVVAIVILSKCKTDHVTLMLQTHWLPNMLRVKLKDPSEVAKSRAVSSPFTLSSTSAFLSLTLPLTSTLASFLFHARRSPTSFVYFLCLQLSFPRYLCDSFLHILRAFLNLHLLKEAYLTILLKK